ncbi:S-adenosyl-L-methionine-dependent methyltransferase [Cladochytrium replicatum]|nr:S-adenosyl-L-methionine-dependent methyltransferase [Cladochytrium replicatum]
MSTAVPTVGGPHGSGYGDLLTALQVVTISVSNIFFIHRFQRFLAALFPRLVYKGLHPIFASVAICVTLIARLFKISDRKPAPSVFSWSLLSLLISSFPMAAIELMRYATPRLGLMAPYVFSVVLAAPVHAVSGWIAGGLLMANAESSAPSGLGMVMVALGTMLAGRPEFDDPNVLSTCEGFQLLSVLSIAGTALSAYSILYPEEEAAAPEPAKKDEKKDGKKSGTTVTETLKSPLAETSSPKLTEVVPFSRVMVAGAVCAVAASFLAHSYLVLPQCRRGPYPVPAALATPKQIPETVEHFEMSHISSIVARQESVSGYVSVVDVVGNFGDIRFLRADHSLIGGVFTSDPERSSVFGTFYYMDFVKYFAREELPDPTNPPRVLQIGLGVGISAKTLTEFSNATVDIAELDPVVYKFAVDHFDLPVDPRAEVSIGDARLLLQKIKAVGLYDYVLHDVFSGGSVPAQLFTLEAFESIAKVLKPDGILAVNFVGSVQSNATRLVVNTIRKVFPEIELHFEMMPHETEPPLNKSRNMIIYAKMSEGPFIFRQPEDWELNGVPQMYTGMLSRFDLTRVDLSRVNFGDSDEEILRDMVDEKAGKKGKTGSALESEQLKSSVAEHWHTMQNMLGMEFWLMF